MTNNFNLPAGLAKFLIIVLGFVVAVVFGLKWWAACFVLAGIDMIVIAAQARLIGIVILVIAAVPLLGALTYESIGLQELLKRVQ